MGCSIVKRGDFFMPKMMFEKHLRERKDSVGGDFDKALQIFIADRKRMGCTERI
jgi:hypothetical protein